MGRLDRLFGNALAIVKEAVLDEQKCIDLFGKLLTEFKQKQALAKNFSPGNVDNALRDWDNTLSALHQIESLIPKELVSIAEDEKLEDELLRDLESLKSVSEIRTLAAVIAHEKRFKEALFTLFSQIHKVLVIELHLIRHIRKKPNNVKHLLIRLFKVIYYTEDALYEVFMEENYEEKELHQEVLGLAHAVLLEKEINEEKEVTEERFARMLVGTMAPGVKHKYRLLAEEVFKRLASKAGVSLPLDSEFEAGLEAIERVMDDDNSLYDIIRALKPRDSDRIIFAIMRAFRQAFHMSHFFDLEQRFR